MSTLAEFTEEVIAGVMSQLPLQTYDSTSDLVDEYITSAGGWVPDDIGDPTGEGHLANDEDSEEFTDTIVVSEYAKIYESTLSLDMTFDLKAFSYLVPGLNEDSIKAAIDGAVRNALTDALEGSGYTITDSVLSSTTSTSGGEFNAARRVAIHAESPAVSFSAIVREELRSNQGLSNLWSISNVYTTSSTSAVAFIFRKYTNTNFNTLDSNEDFSYVVKTDPLTKKLISILRVEL